MRGEGELAWKKPQKELNLPPTKKSSQVAVVEWERRSQLQLKSHI